MSSSVYRWASLGCGVLVALTTAYAAEPVFWRTTTQDDFLRGEVENIAISGNGEIQLSASPEIIYNTDTPFIWSLAVSDNAVWMGSGGVGAITRHQSADSVETLFTTDNLNVQSITLDGNGGVYAGLMPDGTVIALTSDGNSRTLFEPEESYIWALTTNEAQDLFVGTGNPGQCWARPLDSLAAVCLLQTAVLHLSGAGGAGDQVRHRRPGRRQHHLQHGLPAPAGGQGHEPHR